MLAGVPIDGGICYPYTCWDYGLHCSIYECMNGYRTILMSALWCRDVLTLEAVRETLMSNLNVFKIYH
jgi:hypothetical protein